MKKFSGFTLVEVLITLGVIGVVAAITLPSLISNIKNIGYSERLIKIYSTIQQATNLIIAEVGAPGSWNWSEHRDGKSDSGNTSIIEMYKKHLNIAQDCGWNSKMCKINYEYPYKYLNGEDMNSYNLFWSKYAFTTKDGTLIMMFFKYNSNGVNWGFPPLTFGVDLDGVTKGPNKLGRDLFFLYLDKEKKGKILPYTNEAFPDGQFDYRNTCEKNLKGYSCAYRVITEGKMKY